jgi:hypothetical protein
LDVMFMQWFFKGKNETSGILSMLA